MSLSKTCQRCKQTKELSEFHKDASRNDGYAYVCKECRRTHRHEYYEKHKEKLRAEYDPVTNRDKMLQRNYGITLEEYERMYCEQDGKCFICLNARDLLHVDHCHKSGVVRGLLCSPCNVALGGFKDSIENLQRAIQYLEKQ